MKREALERSGVREKARGRERALRSAAAGLAAGVAVCIAWAFMRPASALEGERVLNCAYEVHRHGESCYDGEGRLTCGLADYAAHTHDPDLCYDSEGVLLCPLAETEPHTHGDSCYEEQTVLVCGQEESGGHEHTEDCYPEQDAPSCGLETGAGAHRHTEDCYAPQPVLICGNPEIILHSHSDGCYDENGDLTCGMLQVEEHIHTEDCLTREVPAGEEPEEPAEAVTGEEPEEEPVFCGKEEHLHDEGCRDESGALTCGLEEHTHSLACYSNPGADIENEDIWKQTFAGVELTGDYRGDLLAIAGTQLGYAESGANFRVLEDGTVNGYTRYGAWYGGADFAYEDWCAMFVSFCLHYAGVPAEAFPPESGTQTWIEKLAGRTEGYEGYDLYREAAAHTPAEGDLVFYDQDGDGMADHVGIVSGPVYGEIPTEETVTEETVTEETITEETVTEEPQEEALTGFTAIEGNLYDRVREVPHAFTDPAILGYGVLPEKDMSQTVEGGDYTVTVHYGPEAGLPAGAALQAGEYAPDSEIYQQRYAQAALLYGWEEETTAARSEAAAVPAESAEPESAENGEEFSGPAEETAPVPYPNGFRLFNIGFFVDGTEVEPAAPVKISITYARQMPAAQAYQVTHFGPEEAEAVEASVGGAGQTVEFALDSLSDIGVMAVAAAQANTAGGWGYNDDGSIWWTDPKLELTTGIQENTPYIIAGQSGNHVMAGEEFSCDYKWQSSHTDNAFDAGRAPDTFIKAEPVSVKTEESYAPYQLWYFEKGEGGSDAYYVYFLDSDGARRYLSLGEPAWRSDGGTSRQLQLTSEKTGATCFTAAIKDTDHMELSAVKDGQTFYLNLAGGDANTSGNSGCYGYFWGWTANGSGSLLQIGQYTATQTASRVPTVSPSSTLINLFDYWVTPGRFDANDQDPEKGVMLGGINVDHTLQFDTRKIGDCPGKTSPYVNAGTGDTRLTQGIVASTLGPDGYPQLAGNDVTDSSSESLAYLFDTNFPHNGKASYRDVQGLLQVDSQGYFYYDSRYNMAEFPIDESGNSTSRNSFVVYDRPGVYPNVSGNEGEFFPFNKAPQVAPLNANNTQNTNTEDKILNHYFGMTVTTRFIQSRGGYSDVDRTVPTTFHFSGDDDVWIFIDDILVADLGGKHTRVGVTIDFSTGVIDIDGQDTNCTAIPDTKLKEIFDNAGKTTVEWQTNTASNGTTYTTFKDNTTHTLKFYYLERGNYDSNLDLKFNLKEIPPTSIYKVDQYGVKLAGAKFAVYTTDQAYQYLTTDGNYISIGSDISPDADGVFTVGGQTVSPAYIGSTNEDGDMVFVDLDGMPYSISELKTLFGSYFILREVYVPEGYRTVTDEVYLYTDGSIIFCEDPYKTGVWASPNAQVTATNTLYPVQWDEGWTNLQNDQKTTWSQNGVNWYDPSQSSGAGVTGTLFAVVLKRNDKGVEEIGSWYPVYGNDEEGYTVMGTSGIDSVIEAAKNAQSYGNTIFKYSASGMQVTLENLPGDPTRYFSYLWEGRDQKTYPTLDSFKDQYATDNTLQYFVAYYYTTADIGTNGWRGVTANNTFRVISHTGVSDNVPGFSMQWGTTIEVPNLENRLFVQKMDTAGNRIDGATFALYEAFDAASKTQGVDYNYIYYVGEDANGDTVYVGILDPDGGKEDSAIVFGGDPVKPLGRGSYRINQDNAKPDWGKITVTVTGDDGTTETQYFVSPAVNAKGTPLIDTTHLEEEYVDEDGTAHFIKLKNGKYYLREIEAPAGYTENTAEIPVLVNDNGVYAYAGDKNAEDNGVAVGNGVGYLTKTLDVFASEGMIDETLTWIYGALIENDAKDFSAFEGVSGDDDVLHVGTGENDWKYVMHDPNSVPGYGSENSTNRGDAMVTYLKYSENSTDKLFDYSPNANQTAEGTTADGKSYRRTVTVTTTNADGTETTTSALLRDGEGTRRLYTKNGWSDMAIYQDYAYGTSQITTGSTTYYKDLTDYGNISNLFSSSTFVQVTDEGWVDLALIKQDQGGSPLSGARFRLGKAVLDSDGKETGNYTWYSVSDDGAVVWTDHADSAAVLTSDTEGKLSFSGLPRGVYILEEAEAPAGYHLLAGPVQLTVSDLSAGKGMTLTLPADSGSGITLDEGKLYDADGAEVTDTENLYGREVHWRYTLTVPNSADYELPSTGGRGTAALSLPGAVLVIGAGLPLAVKRRRGAAKQ